MWIYANFWLLAIASNRIFSLRLIPVVIIFSAMVTKPFLLFALLPLQLFLNVQCQTNIKLPCDDDSGLVFCMGAKLNTTSVFGGKCFFALTTAVTIVVVLSGCITNGDCDILLVGVYDLESANIAWQLLSRIPTPGRMHFFITKEKHQLPNGPKSKFGILLNYITNYFMCIS